jgi:hypothetical protein
MQKAMAQALAMQKLERVNDIDIAEVHQSKTLFDGIEQETRPFNSFVKILYALDWLKLDKQDQSAVRSWLDGQYGDPFEIARGRFTLGPTDAGDGHPQPKDVLDQLRNGARQSAPRFAGVLNRARDIVRSEKFQNWQIAFPGVWTQWESTELHGGFHAVIGNPPYVRQELIKDYKSQLKRAFPQTYDGGADLFIYFYHQGLKLLKPGGRLSFVVTNKWLRAGYAEGLRTKFANEAWVEFVADFGHAKKFFPDADVFPSIVVVRRPNEAVAPCDTEICVIPRDDVPDAALEQAVAAATFPRPRNSLSGDSWVLETLPVMTLYDKLFAAGPNLKEYVGMSPLAGIKTGFNKGFIIDKAARDNLVSADPKCSEIIRPFLRGQDVKRWLCASPTLYMIVMKSSADHPWLWAEAGDQAEDTFRNWSPVLHSHFKKFESELKKREDQGRFWWELRPSQNYRHFDADFIAYQDIAYHSAFAHSSGALPEMTAFCLPKADDPYLLAVLNSPLAWHLLSRITLHGKDEALRLKTDKMDTLPIATPSRATMEAVSTITPALRKLVSERNQANALIIDWLNHSFGLKPDKCRTVDFTASEADGFVEVLRGALPKKHKFTAAELAELKREYRTTLEPAHFARAQIFLLEQKLSDLVNHAYGLSTEEVDLLWRTAPPRMPLMPAGDNGFGEESSEEGEFSEPET